ncbi:hypothetical protein [Phaffia rhodozyma]|uniref:Uncharacterized protein n=1 Tax=Phaffia rhodozyma TaxID=264483 RepID=A0A0F7SLU5_PHARH|nr:hypothetical protein [Phaffia rhodozyma]
MAKANGNSDPSASIPLISLSASSGQSGQRSRPHSKDYASSVRTRPESAQLNRPGQSTRQSAYRDHPEEEEEEDEREVYGAPEGEGDGWDIYADFNNAGPRYNTRSHLAPGIEGERFVSSTRNQRPTSSRPGSSMYNTPLLYGAGQPHQTPKGPNSTTGSQSMASLLPSQERGRSHYGKYAASEFSQGGKPASNAEMQISELVTVPVLGAEWKKEELHSLTKKSRKEDSALKRKRKWRAFTRDEDRGRYCCGLSLRQLLLYSTGVLIIIMAIMLYFLIPRVPSFSWAESDPFTIPTGLDNTSAVFSRTPANFTFPATLNLQADTKATYIPITFKSITARLYDLSTDKQVGTGVWKGTMPAKKLFPFSMNVTFSYEGYNSTDPTWLSFYDACAHIYPGTNRTTFDIRMVIDMKAVGVVGTRSDRTSIEDITCPYELASTSV